MIKIHSYPDGGKYVEIKLPFTELVYRINSYEDLFLMKSIKDAHPEWRSVTIPCMFQQQHDRRFNSDESFELRLVCDFINSCGFEKVRVFHPHSDVTPALLNNCEVISNAHFIAQVLDHICTDWENLILMSSDAGGFKPLMKLCKEIQWQGETYSASKARERDKLVQLIDRQDFGGKDILIIDDISVGGGTFKGLAKLLSDRNCGKLYLAVSHMTVQELGDDSVLDYFEKVFTTNSKFGDEDAYTVEGNFANTANLEIINIFA